MNPAKPPFPGVVFFLALCLPLLTGGAALAGTNITWISTAATDWATASNWSPQNIPDTPTENPVFGLKDSLADPSVSSAVAIGLLRFDSSGWTLNGTGTLTLNKDSGGDGKTSLDFTDEESGQNTLNVSLSVIANSAFYIDNPNSVLLINGAVNGPVSPGPLYLEGLGALKLAGPATSAPKWVVRGAELILAHDNALGGGASYIQVGDLATGGSEARLTLEGPRTISKVIRVSDVSNVGGRARIGGNSDDNSTFTGTIQLYNDLNVTSMAVGNRAVTFAGQIWQDQSVAAKMLTKIGFGRVRLANSANNYSGGTFFNGGILAADSDGALGTGGLAFNGGSAEAWQNSIATSRAITINSGGAAFTNYHSTASDQNGWDLSGPISGSGPLTKLGNGFLTLRGNNSGFAEDIVVQSDAAGGTSSRLEVAHNNALGDTLHGTVVGENDSSSAAIQFGPGMSIPEPITLNGKGNGDGLGAMRMYGAGESSTWSGPVTLASRSRIGTDASGAELVLSGRVDGPGALVKVGNGTLTLMVANRYEGGTEVLSGLLQVQNADALPPGHSLTIAAAGTVVLKAGLGYAALSAGLPEDNTALAVPEPGTAALLAAGLLACICSTGILPVLRRHRQDACATSCYGAGLSSLGT